MRSYSDTYYVSYLLQDLSPEAGEFDELLLVNGFGKNGLGTTSASCYVPQSYAHTNVASFSAAADTEKWLILALEM